MPRTECDPCRSRVIAVTDWKAMRVPLRVTVKHNER